MEMQGRLRVNAPLAGGRHRGVIMVNFTTIIITEGEAGVISKSPHKAGSILVHPSLLPYSQQQAAVKEGVFSATGPRASREDEEKWPFSARQHGFALAVRNVPAWFPDGRRGRVSRAGSAVKKASS